MQVEQHKQQTARFLVYGLTDPHTGAVRYIGKSTTGLRRPLAHRTPCCMNYEGDTHKTRWIRQLQAEGLSYGVVVFDALEDSQGIAELEQYRIAYGRSSGWPLTNLTDGGEGCVGRMVSQETRDKLKRVVFSAERRERIGAAHRGRRHHNSPECRAKISATLRGREVSAEHRARLSASQKGKKRRPLSAEHRAKIRAAQLGRKREPWSDDHRVKMIEALTGRKHTSPTPEQRARISATLRGHPVSSETRAKISASLMGCKMSPEACAKMAASRLGRPRTPETCAKMSASRLGRKLSPEHRAKLVEAHRVRRERRLREEASILDRMKA